MKEWREGGREGTEDGKEGGKGGWKERREGGKGREGGEKGKDEKFGSCRYQVGTVYFLATFKSSTRSQVHRVENIECTYVFV